MNVNGAGKVILMALSISYNLEALLFSCGSWVGSVIRQAAGGASILLSCPDVELWDTSVEQRWHMLVGQLAVDCR
jgi:hypothetical protein